MAEIPVKRKSAVPLWLLPAALIALIALGTLAYTQGYTRGESREASIDTVNVTAVKRIEQTEVTEAPTQVPVTTTTTEIIDVDVFAQTPEKLSLVGQAVRLDNAPVARVLSDRVFTVISGNTEFFAMLDKQLDSAGGNEARIVIKPNERRSFMGYFKRVPSAALREEQSSDLPLDSQEYQALEDQQVYLHITYLTN